MQAYLFVFLGGGLGSICRFGIAQLMRNYQADFPWATLTANALSCIILGILVGLSAKSDFPSSLRFFMMIGFCGGFSTFSTFTHETFQLLLNGQATYAFANIAGSLLLCLACIFLGLKLVS